MLEHLDSIQWDQIECASESGAEIPELLQQLDTAASRDEFQKTYAKLLNIVNHQGSIYEATSLATKFLIQLLVSSNDPFRVSVHFVMLGEFLRVTQYHPPTYASQFPVPQSVIHERPGLALYDSVSEGVDHYLKLLFDDDVGVQTCSAYVLSFLIDHHIRVLPALVRCIEQAHDPWLQACGVSSYANVASRSAGLNSKPHVEQMQTWVQQGSSLHMRFAAALGYLSLFAGANNPTPDDVIDTLAQGLMTNLWESTSADSAKTHTGYILHELTPFDIAI